MTMKMWIRAIKVVTLVWASSGLIVWIIYGNAMLKQWGFALPLLFLLVAIQSLLEAVDQRDNRWNWASGMSGAALWLFMAGISWWVQ